MQKTKNFIELEKIIYDNPLSRNLRFTNICANSTNEIFYYDCLLPEVVLLNRINVLAWKSGQLSDEKKFPFSTNKNVNVKEQPKFDKFCWNEAAQKAEKMIPFLEVLVVEKLFDPEFADMINDRIENIKRFFDISKHHNSISKNFQQDNFSIGKTNMSAIIDFNELKSHKTFKEIKFLNKDKDKIYILIEKIFHNFKLLSKYQVSEIYLQVKKIDTYLDNHLKNIYFCHDFTFLNFEEESLSILNKINNYLTSEVDKYLEQCIDNQLSIINNIQENFSHNFI